MFALCGATVQLVLDTLSWQSDGSVQPPRYFVVHAGVAEAIVGTMRMRIADAITRRMDLGRGGDLPGFFRDGSTILTGMTTIVDPSGIATDPRVHR
jgi:hypothetical protein